MGMNRRQVLRAGGGGSLLAVLVAAGIIEPNTALAAEWNKAAFGTTTVADTIRALGGTDATASPDITLVAPDIAENGAVVPVVISSKIPNTQQIVVLIEKNPNTLAALFDIPADTDPSISTRVKMAQTSDVIALVKADGKFYTSIKEVKVTLGGCGG